MSRLASELVVGPGLDGKGTETRLTFDLSATPPAASEQVEGQLTSSSERLRGIVAGPDEHARVDRGGFRSPLT
jgi:hypothetical protein